MAYVYISERSFSSIVDCWLLLPVEDDMNVEMRVFFKRVFIIDAMTINNRTEFMRQYLYNFVTQTLYLSSLYTEKTTPAKLYILLTLLQSVNFIYSGAGFSKLSYASLIYTKLFIKG